MASFSPFQVNLVSDYLQNYKRRQNIETMTADEYAEVLAGNRILPIRGPKTGSNFRQMLREGRDSVIPLVIKANQERPYTRWRINRN
jgi:hypothetical protein